MKVAVVGLGRMGEAIAHRLIDEGHDLTVWNRTEGKADELVERGATEAKSPGEAVAATEVVMTSLSNDDAVRELMLGPDGVFDALGARDYIDTSTTSPALSAELAEAFDRFIAMPVLGAPEAVVKGEATFLAGGPADVIDQLQPLLSSLGGHLKRYARAELATSAKLAVNLLLLSDVATLAEALTVGRAGGLDDDELTDLLCDTPMLAPGVKSRFKGVMDAKGPAWWTSGLAAKDAHLAVELASTGGHELRIGSLLEDLYREVADAGFEDEDMVAVARLYR